MCKVTGNQQDAVKGEQRTRAPQTSVYIVGTKLFLSPSCCSQLSARSRSMTLVLSGSCVWRVCVTTMTPLDPWRASCRVVDWLNRANHLFRGNKVGWAERNSLERLQRILAQSINAVVPPTDDSRLSRFVTTRRLSVRPRLLPRAR